MDAQASTSVDPYKELPQVTRIKGQHLKFSTSAPFTPTFVESHLSSSSDPHAVYASRLQNRHVPLENPARTSRLKQLAEQRKARREEEAARRKKSRGLSRKDAALKGVWSLRKEETRYELFLPLNRLWESYIAELLGLAARPETSPEQPSAMHMPNTAAMQAKLVKADYHGSIISVRKAKNPDLVGCSGIVIHETANTFKVISADNKLKVIPKQNTVFVFRIPLYAPSSESGEGRKPSDPQMEFELYGSQFAFRSTDRATRKFKHKLME